MEVNKTTNSNQKVSRPLRHGMVQLCTPVVLIFTFNFIVGGGAGPTCDSGPACS